MSSLAQGTQVEMPVQLASPNTLHASSQVQMYCTCWQFDRSSLICPGTFNPALFVQQYDDQQIDAPLDLPIASLISSLLSGNCALNSAGLISAGLASVASGA